MGSEQTRNNLAYMLYTLPRIVNAENVKHLSDDLMLAFRWYGSDTYDSVNRSSHIEYGYIDYKQNPDAFANLQRLQGFGLKLKDHDLFLVNIWHFLAENVEFADFKDKCEYCPKISEPEWKGAARFITEYLSVFHSRGVNDLHSRTQGMKVSSRSFTYKLFAASQIVDKENVELFQRDLFSLMGIETEYIDYGFCVNELYLDSPPREFTLKFSNRQIPLWELPHSMPIPTKLTEQYPFLAKQGELKNIPNDFKRNYIRDNETTEDWDKRYEQEFPTLWDAVTFTTFAMLSAFTRVVTVGT